MEFIFPHLQKIKNVFTFTDVRKRSQAISLLLTFALNYALKFFGNIRSSNGENVMIELDWDDDYGADSKQYYKPKIAAAKQTILVKC